MSLYGAMFSGVSGLAAQSQALGMISDNISNINTVGYKGAVARFATLVTQSPTISTYTPGGVRSSPLQRVDQQGLLQGSSSKTDVAIAGNGFFVVHEALTPGPGTDYLFTRAGSFRPDEAGNLVNSAGYFLQGWQYDATGNLPANTSVLSSLSTINISSLSGSARATTEIDLGLNLPSTAAVNDTHAATIQIFDSLGNGHDFTITFQKTATNAWDWSFSDPTLSSSGVVSGTGAGDGTITFNGDGSPATITVTTPVAVTAWTTGATNSAITLNMGTVNLADGVTQFAGNYAIGFLQQDGVRFGSYTGVNIDEDGVVTALFDNGQQLPIYQLPVATFPSPNGLEARAGNAYSQSDRSGDVVLSEANTGGAGVIAPSALEASNVDLAEEFTNMIVTQRAYSASARIISTADEMMEELVRI